MERNFGNGSGSNLRKRNKHQAEKLSEKIKNSKIKKRIWVRILCMKI